MATITINVPGFGSHEGESPIVVLGPNGSGKTQLAQRLVQQNGANAISAQRRTWVDDTLPVQEEQHLKNHVRSQIDQWHHHAWRPTEEINYLLSTLIQDHTNKLTQRNEEALSSGKSLEPTRDTKLMALQSLWHRLFPKRKLEIGGFFPRVLRLDMEESSPYQLRNMSDGERTVLYMATRILTSEQQIILVDEPELHLHSRLAVEFWNEAEKLRPDCRFVYITHDLTFTLSRKNATVLALRQDSSANAVPLEQLPMSVAAEVLGAATLPFYARRVVFYEGETGKGLASEFFSQWFDGDETFAIAAGDRDSVFAAVSGLRTVGVTSAEVVGLVDRDFYSEAILSAGTNGVSVLPLHEIESVFCDHEVISALATHFGKDAMQILAEFKDKVKREFKGQTLSNVVARRVRCRVGDLLDGAFQASQIDAVLTVTASKHAQSLVELDLPSKVAKFFSEESNRVSEAISEGGAAALAVLPGKHLLSLLSAVFGFSRASELTDIVVRSLDRTHSKKDDPIRNLGVNIEQALLKHLPARTLEA